MAQRDSYEYGLARGFAGGLALAMRDAPTFAQFTHMLRGFFDDLCEDYEAIAPHAAELYEDLCELHGG